MFVHVLGAAAGGGFPQWNCNCPNCDGLRKGTIKATARTQSSIAVSANGVDWVLFNTSPDILAQLAAFPALQPARAVRDTGIKAIVFMDSQIDHATGLLMLRAGCPHQVYCSDPVYQDLTTGFPIFKVLEHWNGGINRHSIPLNGDSFKIEGIEQLSFTALVVDGKAPPYSPHRYEAPDTPVDCVCGGGDAQSLCVGSWREGVQADGAGDQAAGGGGGGRASGAVGVVEQLDGVLLDQASCPRAQEWP